MTDKLVEKVARAIDETGVPESWRPHSKIAARAVIPIIEAALLQHQFNSMPPEMYGPPMYYLREYARKRGLKIEEDGVSQSSEAQTAQHSPARTDAEDS